MKALILVDIQNDFLPGGALEVPSGDAIVPLVNELLPLFNQVVATQDWHPAQHLSFASNHSDVKIGDVIDLNGLDQILWPDHCVQHSKGAAFSDDLNVDAIQMVFQKGTDINIDSYSGFFDNGHTKDTGLGAYLHSQGITEVFIVGLATDYCVKFTALDAVKLGFDTTVITDATRAVNLHPQDSENALKEMQQAGVHLVTCADLKSTIN